MSSFLDTKTLSPTGRAQVGKTMGSLLLTLPRPCVLPTGAHHILGPRAQGTYL